MRVAIIFDNFGPYHLARLAEAARRMEILGVQVAATSADYGWSVSGVREEFQSVTLVDDGLKRSDCSLLMAAYNDRIAPWFPDVVALPGWSSVAALVGAQWAINRGIPIVVMSDSNANDYPRKITTELIKRRIVTLFQAGLCSGTRARDYLSSLGLPYNRIFPGYDAVDNHYFWRAAENVRETEKVPKGVKLSWRGRYFLASARFVPSKNLTRLMEAFACYRHSAGVNAWPLVLLGDGPMRGEHERRRAALGLETALIMPGFKQYEDLPLYYGSAGAFVHASTTEQWGLVVNEAMASGLPMLVSERCGCVPDLVENGRNGYTFDPYDVDALARLMRKIASDTCDRGVMGRASREIIACWSPETFAEGLWQAASAALEAPIRGLGLLERTLLWVLSYR